MKKILVIVAVIAVLCAFGVYAGEGCPHAKGDAKHECSKECAKKGCTHGKDSTCAAMGDGCKALQADLSQMEKGVKPADQDAFLKTHADNIKKVVEMQGKMAASRKGDKACCAKADSCDASIKVLKSDMEKMGKSMTETEKADFMKAHQANLKKFLDVKAECEKACQAKGAEKKPAEKKADNK